MAGYIEQIDLSYYDLFGCLKLDLRNGHKLQTRQVTLKEAVVEVFNCRKGAFCELRGVNLCILGLRMLLLVRTARAVPLLLKSCS